MPPLYYRRRIHTNKTYKHFKGKFYKVIAIAKHTETDEKFVVYQALYQNRKVYIRPYDMFVSEVDSNKYPKVNQRYRFELVHNIEPAEENSKEEFSIIIDTDIYSDDED